MKNLIIVGFITLLFASCKKNELAQERYENDNKLLEQNAFLPTPVPAYKWTKLPNQFPNQYPFNYANGRNLVLKGGDDTYLLSGSVLEFMYRFNKASQQFETYTPPPTNSVGFTIFSAGHQYLFSFGNLIYGGLRGDGSDTSFFFAIDPQTAVIQQLARYPGSYPGNALSFVVGNKGYVISGYTATLAAQVWEYDFAANTWSNKGNSPLGKREGATVFVVNGNVYMGLGFTSSYISGQYIRFYKKDWIKYTPGSVNSAVQADFPGAGRDNSRSFDINGNIYVGFGENRSAKIRYTDLWKYSPSSNSWVQEANWPGYTSADQDWISGPPSDNLGCFASGSSGFLVRGAVNQLWKFSMSSLVATN